MNWNAKLKRIAAILLAILLVIQVSPIDAEWGDSGSHAVYSDWWSPGFVQRTPEYPFSGVCDSIHLMLLLGMNGIYGTITSIKDDTITLAVGQKGGAPMEMTVARWAIRQVEEVTVENEGEILA